MAGADQCYPQLGETARRRQVGRQVLLLIDQGNLGRQAKKELDQYLNSNDLDTAARVTISAIQRTFTHCRDRATSMS